MIHVEITLWPGGDKDQAKHLGTILIANDGSSEDLSNVGNYQAVLTRRGKPRSIWKEIAIKAFPRKRLGAYDLLYRVLKEAVGERNE